MRTHRVCLFLAAVMLLLVALPGATAARIVPSNTLHLKQLRHAAAAKITELKAALGHEAKSEVESVRDVFHEWTLKHGKTYDSEEEKELRMRIFADNHAFVARHNAEYEKGEHTHFVGLNHLADLTKDEFKRMLGYDRTLRAPRAPVDASTWEYADVTPPETIDWVAEGAVTPVKNQKQCGSCWAFSTTGAVEGANFLKTGELVSLSEQQLVDCDHTCDPKHPRNCDYGCNGGLPLNAMRYVQKNGLDTETDYPYHAVDGKCASKKNGPPVASVSAFNLVSTDEAQIAAALVKHGPLSIGIDAAWMQTYVGGVACPWLCNKDALDHGVLIVGYGEEGFAPARLHKEPYWVIKNSWGMGWGEEGYYRICKDKGNCGVNNMVVAALNE